MKEITVTKLKEKLDAGEDVQLIDVRNPDEVAIANLEGSKLIPMGEIMERKDEVEANRYTVVFCRSGVRSARVIEFLEHSGHEGELANLAGGILAWSDQIDPSIPKY